MCVCVCVCVHAHAHVYPPPPHEQDAKQGQFLSGVLKVWIKGYPSPRLVAIPKRFKDSHQPCYLPITFSRVLVLCEIKTKPSRIWTRVTVSISYYDNRYNTNTPSSLSLYIYIYIYYDSCYNNTLLSPSPSIYIHRERDRRVFPLSLSLSLSVSLSLYIYIYMCSRISGWCKSQPGFDLSF